MKCLVFFCGSLEDSRDGVGDFTLKLATLLVAKGFNCACIAINDWHISENIIPFSCHSTCNGVFIHRISARCPWTQKVKILNRLLAAYRPDIVSLQYVPYSFNAKGIPFSLLKWLPALKTTAAWHLMCHELWVDPRQKFSNCFLSLLQRVILAVLVFKLKPKIVHTSNCFYADRLTSIGVKANIIPVLSSIKPALVGSVIERSKRNWTFVFFGMISKDWKYERLISAIELARQICKIDCCIFQSIGYAGHDGTKIWESLVNSRHAAHVFNLVGPLSGKDISGYLQLANFGITTTPAHLVGKSATVSAMLSHGLSVVVPRVLKPYSSYNLLTKRDPRFILFDNDFQDNMASAARHVAFDQNEKIAADFINSFADIALNVTSPK